MANKHAYLLKLPGLVDAHIHLRDDISGVWAYKEDFTSGTQAALAGHRP